MRHLVVDTETTGIPRTRRAPVTDLGNWPRLVQLAWAECDGAEEFHEAEEHMVRPDGFRIPAASSRIHGITTAAARDKGEPLEEVIGRFLAAVGAEATTLVAHNLDFDRPILGAELLRTGYSVEDIQRFFGRPSLCLMKAAAPFCAIPGRYGKWKYPTLTELHAKLFGEPPAESHRAMADVEATARCFLELRRRGVVG